MSQSAFSINGLSPPGFRAPSTSFDQPFDMLKACHERVERTLGLLNKLVDHVFARGIDAQARSAAIDVLRYFDIAAPLHHQDEELHVFPMLLALGDAALGAQVQRMQADHHRMDTLWAELRPWLVEIADCDKRRLDLPQLSAAAREFTDVYAAHIETEERLLYPAAERLCTTDALRGMGEEMRQRRTQPVRAPEP